MINSNISDHEIIFITRKHQVRYSGKITFTGRSYKHYNVNSFQEKLTSMNWEDYYRLDNPDLLWDNMERKITQILDVMCPYKTYSVKETKEPWVTPEVLEQIKRKDEIWRAAKRSKDSRKMGEARKLRNKTTEYIRICKQNYIKNIVHENLTDQKKIWNEIGKLLPGGNKVDTIIDLVNQNNNNVIERDDTADYINRYFLNIGTDLALNYNNPWSFFGPAINAELNKIKIDKKITS